MRIKWAYSLVSADYSLKRNVSSFGKMHIATMENKNLPKSPVSWEAGEGSIASGRAVGHSLQEDKAVGLVQSPMPEGSGQGWDRCSGKRPMVVTWSGP